MSQQSDLCEWYQWYKRQPVGLIRPEVAAAMAEWEADNGGPPTQEREQLKDLTGNDVMSH